MNLDHSVYPDLAEPPLELIDDGDKADYVHRICGAWDFGVPPWPETVTLFSGWKDIFDRFPIPQSPSYHAFRDWFGWESVPRAEWFGQCAWELLDTFEDRKDPCDGLV